MIIIFHEFLNFKIKLLILNLYLLRPLFYWMFIQQKYHYKGNISSWLCLSVSAYVRRYVCRCLDSIITLICAIPCSKCFIKSCIKSNQPSLFYIEKLKEKNNLPKVRQLVSCRPGCKPRCLPMEPISLTLSNVFHMLLLKWIVGTSLVFQWLRIHLPMQGTWVRSLVGELRSHMLQGN